MKLVLLSAVIIAAAFTANCRDISDEQQPIATLNSEEQLPGNHKFTERDQFFQNGRKNVKGQMGVELRGKKDKKVLKELIYKLESLDNKLKSMMKNITNGDLKLKMDLQTIQEHQFNITNTNTDIKKNLQTLKKNQDNMTESNKDFMKDLQIIKENQNNITNSNRDLKTDLQTLKEHQNNITDVILKNITDSNIQLKTDMSSVKQSLSSINSGNSQLKTDVSSVKYTLTNINSGNSQLKADVSSVKQTLANINSGNSQLKSDASSMKQTLTNLNSGNAQLKTDVSSMKQALTNVNYGNSQLKTVVSSMKQTLTNVNSGNSQLRTDMYSMKQTLANINSANSRLNTDLSSMKQTLTNMNSGILSKLDSISSGPPESLFQPHGSGQFFKLYNDTLRNRTEANFKCLTEGMQLAEPINPLVLRKYITETYGDSVSSHVHVGARGTGTQYRWEHSGRYISNSDSLWWPGEPSTYVSIYMCLYMRTSTGHYNSRPNQLYYTYNCQARFNIVCEYVQK